MISNFKLVIFLFFNISIITLSCLQIDYYNKITLNKDFVYWDAEIGNSWYINKNGKSIWYHYKNNERYIVDFGDIVIDYFNWEINYDTIFFYINKDDKPMAKYQILNINDSLMSMRDVGKYGSEKVIVFKYSMNQFEKPKESRTYEIYKIDLDTLKRIYPDTVSKGIACPD